MVGGSAMVGRPGGQQKMTTHHMIVGYIIGSKNLSRFGCPGLPGSDPRSIRENRLHQGKNKGFNTKSNKNNGFQYKINRNGLGWMGIHAPKTLNSEKPFLDFGLSQFCATLGGFVFFFKKKHVPISKRHIFDVFDQTTSNLVPILSHYG